MAVCPNGHDSVAKDFCDACGVSIGARPSGRPARVVGKHHAGGPRPTGSPQDTCPWCGNLSSGQFCEHCGFRVRRPFAPLSEPQSEPRPEPRSGSRPAAPEWSDVTSWSSVPASPPAPVATEDSDRPAFLDWFKAPEPSVPEDPPAPPEPSVRPEPPTAPRPVPPASSAPPTAPLPVFTPSTWSVVVTSDRAYYDRMQLKRVSAGSAVSFPGFSTERRFPLAGKQMRIGRRSPARGVEPEIDLSGPPVDPGISRLHALLLPAADGSWAVLDPGSANGTLLNGREIAPGDLIPLREGDRINLGAWTAITVHRE
jgi:FHA domain